ncbi:hypothetical protein HCN44_005674 [Aphidius gifuensis]|uniref:Serpin domain-containing protein n=1 Tax=Aphidius gifuensis TaxID=684658 RepID=A0A835CVF4_APHGI|nr:hypothetical protein HCN44_005674 [Aphidius gifuensis]
MKTLILLFIVATTCLSFSHGLGGSESKVIPNSINQMSIDFFKVALDNQADNFVCSPFSVAHVLAISAFGSQGNTRDEIITVLHMKNYYKYIEKLHKKYNLTGSFDLVMKSDSLKMANKMYVNENISVKPNFKNGITSIFKSDVESLNFKNSFDAADKINNWVEKETNNIKNLVKSYDFDDQTALALIDAVYFKDN